MPELPPNKLDRPRSPATPPPSNSTPAVFSSPLIRASRPASWIAESSVSPKRPSHSSRLAQSRGNSKAESSSASQPSSSKPRERTKAMISWKRFAGRPGTQRASSLSAFSARCGSARQRSWRDRPRRCRAGFPRSSGRVPRTIPRPGSRLRRWRLRSAGTARALP